MTEPHHNQTRRTKTRWALGLLALAQLAGAMTTVLVRPPAPQIPVESTTVAPLANSRTNLVLVAGRLCLSGETSGFTGLMIEHSADGSLRSRSSVSNGLLHGISEGWHTNGQLQVTENFREGVSHGLRTKWHANGTKLSTAMIADGQLHGSFRRWHENGIPAEEVEFKHGQPDGLSRAYFPSGSLKGRVAMKHGLPIEQEFWKDGEKKE